MIITLAQYLFKKLKNKNTKKAPNPSKNQKPVEKAGFYVSPNPEMRAKLLKRYENGERTYPFPGGLLFIQMPDPTLNDLKTLASYTITSPKTLTKKQKNELTEKEKKARIKKQQKELADASNSLAAYIPKKLGQVKYGVHTEIIDQGIGFELLQNADLRILNFPVIGTTYRRHTSQRKYGAFLPKQETGTILLNKTNLFGDEVNDIVNDRFWEVQQFLIKVAATKKNPDDDNEHTIEMDRNTIYIDALGAKPAIDSYQPTLNKNYACEPGYFYKKAANCSDLEQDSYLMAFEHLLSAWYAYLTDKKDFDTPQAKKIFEPFGDQAAFKICRERVYAYQKTERSTSLPGKKQKLFLKSKNMLTKELGTFRIVTKTALGKELRSLKTQTRYFDEEKDIKKFTSNKDNLAYYIKLMSEKQRNGIIEPLFFPKTTPKPRSKKQLRKDLTRGALETLQYFITTQISEHPQITLALARYLLPSALTENTVYRASELALTTMCLTKNTLQKRNGLGDSVVGFFNIRQELSNINTPIMATPDAAQLHFG
jgi:hypothetical protein